MDAPAPTLLTVAECAQATRVSAMTIYRLIHAGHLPAIRIGRSFRVLESDWEAYLRDLREAR